MQALRMTSEVGRTGGQVERDIEQAITALKKGASLLKNRRRGKPKFCYFRLANDESVLIWFSGKKEKHLKLSHVSRIISGQRTAIFQRYPRPEKECQSFSLIYKDRSLDLICKDKTEAEVWFSGLKALISRCHQIKWSTETRSDGSSSEANSPQIYTQRSAPLHSLIGSGYSSHKADTGDQLPPKGAAFFPWDSTSASVHSVSSRDSDGQHAKGVEASRVSFSSQGSGHDALGDVFLWGDITADDAKIPKALESSVVLDVQNIACGGRHAALVTKQGEIFSWGEECGGRLGHGVDSDVLNPKLIDSLSNTNIELVACGEYHTCAVTLSGELYTWGNGHFGILGHGNEISHWVPKQVNGPLEGIHVSFISCGPFHTALVTSSGQLFTFGDGTFGVLGHGDRKSVFKPREVESLKGLRTVRAACGIWHTAAVVEVMAGNSSSSRKLFTWGDGDTYRLGHGNKEVKLVPTCVAALVDQNFCQVACGHSMTVAVTTSGHVYTMGSQMYGQLGNPKADGKLPTRVEGKLSKIFVEEIACGANHVVALTSKADVYTWGKGANGQLGHGDTDDRNFPTLVEGLKDKQVTSIACGTNFTAVICLHKWISGTDQSMCSGCHQPFSFKRKRHNCYNCGLVFCHSCSSQKSLRASMAFNPHKPYRVCDTCANKLKKSVVSSLVRSVNLDKDDISEPSFHTHLARYSSVDSLRPTENHSLKRNKKLEFNSRRVSPIPNANGSSSKPVNPVIESSKMFFSASVPGSRISSRATSPISRRSIPPRSTTPIPTLGGLSSPKIVVFNEANLSNYNISQEVVKLRAQVENFTRKVQLQEIELERISKQRKEAIAIAEEESSKRKAANEVIQTLTAQMKAMAQRLPVGAIQSPSLSSSDILLNGSNGPLISNVARVEAAGSRINNGESQGDEWVEQNEPGVYVTLRSLPGGAIDLKRVRFSRKRFSDQQAEQWWAENRQKVYHQYNVRVLDKSSVGILNQ